MSLAVKGLKLKGSEGVNCVPCYVILTEGGGTTGSDRPWFLANRNTRSVTPVRTEQGSVCLHTLFSVLCLLVMIARGQWSSRPSATSIGTPVMQRARACYPGPASPRTAMWFRAGEPTCRSITAAAGPEAVKNKESELKGHGKTFSNSTTARFCHSVDYSVKLAQFIHLAH
ncbi:hypothetical protein AB205_0189000 [Aquarana catesbeiana]|uniref:Uncharacterized protein n=1 Tax=Aquarana catesbeiana TaxID=8400 RepID=A0A2G9SGW6_AQUCT|nr:hypothetical protein AB205_0189000 [Aquarana catesbeiana]